ncbi:MAG: hypothetical protein ACMVP2_26820 [Imperialibacter sp.]|uniref:hypothetical protein n=1 Tax=Imperialibacter sp. TaxID=2038411 RepID=UPI003A88F1FB
MDRERSNRDIEDFKYLIDSRNLSSKEKREERNAILKAREIRFRSRSENEARRARLMQLKYQMDDHVSSPTFSAPRFTDFLRSYIDILYDKQKDFATDMQVTPMTISHILNGHREPQEEFLFGLIDHSQQTFRELGGFSWDLWPRVYYQDKVFLIKESGRAWAKTNNKKPKGRAFAVGK